MRSGSISFSNEIPLKRAKIPSTKRSVGSASSTPPSLGLLVDQAGDRVLRFAEAGTEAIADRLVARGDRAEFVEELLPGALAAEVGAEDGADVERGRSAGASRMIASTWSMWDWKRRSTISSSSSALPEKFE